MTNKHKRIKKNLEYLNDTINIGVRGTIDSIFMITDDLSYDYELHEDF